MKTYIRTYNRRNRKRTLATARHEELAESRSRSEVVVTPQGELKGFEI